MALEALEPPVTGIQFDDVEISGDEDEFEHTWREGRPDSELGKWYWFKITGKAGKDDFGLIPTAKLVISERVAVLLKEKMTVINPARKISPWQGQTASIADKEPSTGW